MFKANSILSEKEIIAQILREARVEKKKSLKMIAERLNINIKYLSALENGEFNKLPEGIYGKNFLKQYAEYLNLDYKNLSKIFNDEYKNKGKTELFSKQKIKKQYLIIIPKIFKTLIIVSAVILLFTYLGFSLNKAASVPKLNIISPDKDIIIKEKTYEIKGSTESETEISINGEIINTDRDGTFSKLLSLKVGLNTIIITARKKYGKENTIIKQILVENN